jgi:AraC-like DNA-binding protein
MRKLPLSRAGQIFPLLDMLRRNGAPIDRALERHKLPRKLLGNPDLRVSTRALATFLEDTGRREGVEDIGWCVVSAFDGQMSGRLKRTVRTSPSLFCMLDAVCTLAHFESSRVSFWMRPCDEAVLICSRGSLEPTASGMPEFAKMRLGILIELVRQFAGPNWFPTECGFETDCKIGALMAGDLPDTRLWRGKEYDWVRVPRFLLARPPLLRESQATGTPIPDSAESEPDVVASLLELLRPYVAENVPTVHEAAELSGTSVRTLQRQLTEAGCNYRDVVQRVRFETARELLKEPEGKLVDIACVLGYADQAHFTRAFRRWTGVAPGEYRAQLHSG